MQEIFFVQIVIGQDAIDQHHSFALKTLLGKGSKRHREITLHFFGRFVKYSRLRHQYTTMATMIQNENTIIYKCKECGLSDSELVDNIYIPFMTAMLL